jgi:hypothetical protein
LIADPGNGTGTAWGDFDNDGDMDFYLANDGMADKLLRQQNVGIFSLVYGGDLDDMGHGRGVLWADLDNDADLDLYVTRHDEPDLLLRNEGEGFVRVPVGWAEADGPSETAACGDLDGDGDLDLYITRADGQPNVLMRNEMAAGNHWLHIRLIGTESNLGAVGARIYLYAGGIAQLRQVSAGGSYLAQHAPLVAFGLGQTTSVDSVKIRWPSGAVQTVTTGLGLDRTVAIVAGDDPIPVAVGDFDSPPAFSLSAAYPNPFNPVTTIAFELSRTEPVKLEIFALDGRCIATLVAGELPAGKHQAVWRGTNDEDRPVPSGVYLYRLTAGTAVAVGRLTLVK